MSEIRAIFLDAAGTILHAYPSVGHVYAEMLGRYGALVDPETMDRAFRKAFAARRGVHSSSLVNEGYGWWRALVFEVLDELQIEVHQPDELFRELYWRFADTEVWRLFPDVLPALLEARGRGLKTALVSNWDVRLRRLIEGMGIASLFDALVISTEAACEKPDPRMFRLACERVGVAPNEAIHVGDNQREDIEGARAAGMSARLLDRTGSNDEEKRIITDLRQLYSLIGSS